MKYINSQFFQSVINNYEKRYFNTNHIMKYFDPSGLKILHDKMLEHWSTIDIIHCKDCELRGSICCPFRNTPDDGFCHQGTIKD